MSCGLCRKADNHSISPQLGSVTDLAMRAAGAEDAIVPAPTADHSAGECPSVH